MFLGEGFEVSKRRLQFQVSSLCFPFVGQHARELSAAIPPPFACYLHSALLDSDPLEL